MSDNTLLFKLKKFERADFEIITDIVEPHSKVLDLGCGDGRLLRKLMDRKHVRATGIEISEEGVQACVEKGLSVMQADIDEGLSDYPDKYFDYVILSHTLHAVKRPRNLVKELIRVGKTAIVSFPNFGYFMVRFRFLWHGRMPYSSEFPFPWYDSPNIHICTIRDFKDFCAGESIEIIRQVYLGSFEQKGITPFPNFFAKVGIFQISDKGKR